MMVGEEMEEEGEEEEATGDGEEGGGVDLGEGVLVVDVEEEDHTVGRPDVITEHRQVAALAHTGVSLFHLLWKKQELLLLRNEFTIGGRGTYIFLLPCPVLNQRSLN